MVILKDIIGWIVLLGFLLGIIYVIIRMKTEDEEYYPLKVIGYYFLGAFRFSINTIHIPFGFILFLLFFRNPRRNLRSKKCAALLGLAAMLTSLVIPVISNAYCFRERIINTGPLNLYEMSFKSIWCEIKEKLELDNGLEGEAKLEKLNINYEMSGKITRVSCDIIWRRTDGFYKAWIHYDVQRHVLRARPGKFEQWNETRQVMNADDAFDVLDNLDLKELSPEEKCDFYGLWFSGIREAFKTSYGKVYIVTEGNAIPYESYNAVECYWVQLYGMVPTGKDSYTSDYKQIYLLDAHVVDDIGGE